MIENEGLIMTFNLENEWIDKPRAILDEDIAKLDRKLKFMVPRSFIYYVRFYDGCTPKKSDFKYIDFGEKPNIGCIGAFIPIKHDGYSSILQTFQDPPEFFPHNLVAFAEVGNGDLVCFDYRNNPKTDNPPIVYWNHEAQEGRDVSFVAKDFEEFLSILKEPEDLY